jgi:hypothetical protein
LAQNFLIPNSSVSIKLTVSRFTFTSSATILNANLRSDRTRSQCFWWPSTALLNFNNDFAFRKYFVPAKGVGCWHCITSKGILKFWCVVVALSPSITHTHTHTQGRHNAARCSALPFPWRGSQTPPDTTST